jgi:glycerol-3-phosphate O-acyltransferase
VLVQCAVVTRGASRKAAAEIATRINEASVAQSGESDCPGTVGNAPSTCRRRAFALQRLIVALPGTCSSKRRTRRRQHSPAPLDAQEVVAYAERLAFVERFRRSAGRSDPGAVTKQAPLLAYFRNNVLHLFALPAVIACLMSHNRRLDSRAHGAGSDAAFTP